MQVSKDSWLIPITWRPVRSACATHSIAQTWVTITTAPGAAARNSSVIRPAASRTPAARRASPRRARTSSRCQGSLGVQACGGWPV